jgi:hypothetical protein
MEKEKETETETACEYVSSRGLLKSCTIHSPAPRSSNGKDVGYLIDFLKFQNTKWQDIPCVSIYVCSEMLAFFQRSILPKVRRDFILVSGDSDLCVFCEALTEGMFFDLVSHPHLKAWHAQNMMLEQCLLALKLHNAPTSVKMKLKQMPIGMDYHTISSNPHHHWRLPDEGTTPVSQETLLKRIALTELPPFWERSPRIYSNVHLAFDRFGDRRAAISEIPDTLLYCAPNFIPRTQTWRNMKDYAFMLCGYGNGFDCHRTWETLCLGGIPIVRGHLFDELYKDLPVLIVDKWSDITAELLASTIETCKQKYLKREYNMEKLTLAYYTQQWQ